MPVQLPHLLLSVTLLCCAPPLLLGIITRTKAAVAGRQGAPVLQPYRELRRLWGKETVLSQTTTSVFQLGPLLRLATLLLAAALVPMGGHRALISFDGDLFVLVALLAVGRFALSLAALDTGSPFEGMGAAREVAFGALSEPSLLLGLLIVSRLTGTTSLNQMLTVELWRHWNQSGAASLALVTASWFIVLLAENARMPFDDPTTHLELTMVHEAMVLDHSGPLLGVIQYASAVQLFLYAALLQRVILPSSGAGPWQDWLIFAAALVAIAVLVGLVESTLARMRLITVPKLLVAAMLSAAFGVLLLTRN